MVKILKTDEQYDTAIDRRSKLNDIISESPEGTTKKETDELEILALVIGEYEKVHFPAGVKLRMKPCPFRHDKKELIVDIHRQQGYFVFCRICKASGPYGKGELEAVEIWNDRQKIT